MEQMDEPSFGEFGAYVLMEKSRNKYRSKRIERDTIHGVVRWNGDFC